MPPTANVAALESSFGCLEPAVEHDPDDLLMAAARGGDRGAFGELVERHHRSLVRYLTRLVGDPDRAEDLGQEAFLRLWRHAAQYREEGRFAAYLYRIATNLVRSEERRARTWRLVRPLFGPRDVEQSSPPLAADQVLADEAASRLREALAELPVRFRAPVLLAEIEGWSYAEIASALDCRAGTVKSRIFRAKQRLREALASYWEAAS